MAAVCRGRGGVGEGEGGALTSHGGGAAQIRAIFSISVRAWGSALWPAPPVGKHRKVIRD
uniref:Uncharacterized protein n=1 Tax=Aegilops tauschii TaxID=37682 RepID=M8B7F0_AEGTA